MLRVTTHWLSYFSLEFLGVPNRTDCPLKDKPHNSGPKQVCSIWGLQCSLYSFNLTTLVLLEKREISTLNKDKKGRRINQIEQESTRETSSSSVLDGNLLIQRIHIIGPKLRELC